MHILLVDDDRATRESLAKLLAAKGHTVSEAADGEIAIKMLATFKPDLVITDLLMPVLDGIAFVVKAKEKGLLECPFGVISAYDPEGESMDGAVFTLHKPVDLEAVVQRVDLIAKGQVTA